jgi:hypothetical protein
MALYEGADVDSMCYACTCSLISAPEGPLVGHSHWDVRDTLLPRSSIGLCGVYGVLVVVWYCSELDCCNQGSAAYCDQFNMDLQTAQWWGIVAVLLANIVNQVLRFFIILSSSWLKAHTKGGPCCYALRA